MLSEKHKNLAENLKNMRIARGLSLVEFSKELDVPKATLQSILEGGHTTLHTAVHISEKLSISLDELMSRGISSRQIKRIDAFMSQFRWFDRLEKEQQTIVCQHLMALVQLMQEGRDE